MKRVYRITIDVVDDSGMLSVVQLAQLWYENGYLANTVNTQLRTPWRVVSVVEREP